MNPKEELRRFWKSLGIVLIALALLIWTQWNMWPPPTDHTPWQEVVCLPLLSIVVFGSCNVITYWEYYTKAKKGLNWWEPSSDFEKIQQYQRLRQLDKSENKTRRLKMNPKDFKDFCKLCASPIFWMAISPLIFLIVIKIILFLIGE